MKIEIQFYDRMGEDLAREFSRKQVLEDDTAKACSYFKSLVSDHSSLGDAFCYIHNEGTKFVFMNAPCECWSLMKTVIRQFPCAKMTIITEDDDETVVENINLDQGKISYSIADFENLTFYTESTEAISDWLAGLE